MLIQTSIDTVTLDKISSQVMQMVTGHLSEGLFVRNVVVQIPKFDANPKSNPNPNSNPSPNRNPMPIRFGQMTLRQVNCYRCRYAHMHKFNNARRSLLARAAKFGSLLQQRVLTRSNFSDNSSAVALFS